jgi:glycosyltransferase involved in cell wall biosynthesis
MRIGIDTTALPAQPGGAGTYIIQLVRALTSLDCDHDFVIFANQDKHKIFVLEEKGNVQWVLGSNKKPARRLIWEQTTLPRLARETRIDILHSPHYTRPLQLGCRSVVTFHDMTFFLTPHLHGLAKRIFFPIAIRYSARQADALIAVSDNTRRDSIRILGISPDKIATTPLGVDPRFRPILKQDVLLRLRKKYNLPEKFLLFLGTIEPRKNLPTLLGAFSHLVNNGFSYDLAVVGQVGWMHEEVDNLVEKLDLNQRIHFTGYLPTEDLPAIYNLADAFIYPSVYEGFGIPPLEAMACGTPVITTKSSSMMEIVGDAGILVDPINEETLADAILTLSEDKELQGKFSKRGLQRAATFTWERTAHETLKIYERVVKS